MQISNVPSSQTLRKDLVTGLYLGFTYQDGNTNKSNWLPVMRISWDEEGYYYYSYTQAFQDNYQQIKGIILNPKHGYTQTWKDRSLPMWFDGRIPRRPDSMQEYDLFGLGDRQKDVIALFARNGGKKHGDNFDVFPEVRPDDKGNYCFWFRVYGLPTLIKFGNEEVETIANTIVPGQKLNIKLLNGEAKIYCQGVHIGYCPQYIHFLLSLYPECKYEAVADIVNREDFRYAYRIIVKFELSSQHSIFNHKSMKSINRMPV